ncbi:indole-3-glycerol phosphate synthase TrpC [Numidum massiliense]|uniref:indole-3-glycerol phosphate synthase TrpC n=1 Tax=Numidum massiliense TaxID=1522315 RepID=UPI0009E781E4|nr:indole-3-glycerol phosphate synthase TrpC [Numidum massiliense]
MFLERILAVKAQEVAQLRGDSALVQDSAPASDPASAHSPAFIRSFESTATSESTAARAKRPSLAEALAQGPDGFGLIAEVKKASPSKGVIRPDFDPVALARAYEAAGAQAISVLTDRHFFQGDIGDLVAIREHVRVPLLRKDFIIDRLQIDESVRAGADAILLIAAALGDAQLADLCQYARRCGLDVLLEVHTAREVAAALRAKPNVIGINNRDLHTFDVSLAVTAELAPLITTGIPVISESGISRPEDVAALKDLGVSGMLVGEFFMRQSDVTGGVRALCGPSTTSANASFTSASTNVKGGAASGGK